MAPRNIQSHAHHDASPIPDNNINHRRPLLQSRSRNGCNTCRIRRVKCDEERPHCRRCQSTGRKCDGYNMLPTKQQQANNGPSEMRIIQHTPQVTQPTHMWMFPTVDKLLTEEEYRSLEFFHARTAACFGARAGGHLLNAACQDPGIRLAAMALCSLQRVVLHGDNTPPHASLRGKQLALQQYNSAIRRGLKYFPGNGDGSADSILSMCVLFFCFESLQGHFRAAFRHVAAGLRILAQQQLRGRPVGNTLLPPDVIQSIFAVLESQMLEIDGKSPLSERNGLLLVRGPGLPQPLWTLEEANDSFRHIYNDFLRLLSFSSTLDVPHTEAQMAQIVEQILARYHQVQADLDAWSLEFDCFLVNVFRWDGADPASHQLVRMLQLWRTMMGVLLHMEWPPAETAWDGHLSEFTTVLNLAEEIILMSPPPVESSRSPPAVGKTRSSPSDSSSPAPDERPPSSSLRENSPIRHDSPSIAYATILPRPPHSSPSYFSMSLGILPALWTVATRCRDSRVRYRAIDIIGRSKRREGVWDSDLYFRLALQIAHREEQGAGLDLGAEYTPADIPPEVRVTVDGKFEEGREAKITFMRKNVKIGDEIFQW
ncbi:putative Zn(II)2Cys6 transcription factor [Aspergillus uvarum CBS 121591]|uniref:Putative Zn(II)2Cys6 transcription factor n=1 Tax=Aspergillus uvarum CBS 121591 TaxID=1448315 RepID=A0A319DDC9_9EURO|nr:putative Zn(II)2Cys6 transcription factor [Aspergillus uvarum CBS 121591]PYH86078.1 putative Zn(II)2Cys6 transcription factor [Aspergillus uvarum CBS 121591]